VLKVKSKIKIMTNALNSYLTVSFKNTMECALLAKKNTCLLRIKMTALNKNPTVQDKTLNDVWHVKKVIS
jgi:hypothetical protein